MSEKFNETGTAMQVHKPVDDGWNSPIDDDGGGRQIQGTLLRYDDKQWFAGKEKTVIPNGTCFIVLDIKTGWKRWENGKVVEFVTEVDGHYPKRHELGYDDESAWECGPDDKPTDPWQNSREGLLIDPHTCVAYTFCTASAGGRSAVDDLKNAVRNARRVRPGVVPMISLEWQPMPTQLRHEVQAVFQDHGLEHSRRGGDRHRARQRRNERSDHLTNVAKGRGFGLALFLPLPYSTGPVT